MTQAEEETGKVKLLGLSGSYRKMGNTEVAVKEALRGAEEVGADVEILRLADLRIEVCKGCMACIFKSEECRIADDWHMFRDRVLECDAAILGAPTYFLAPAGIVKMLTDRNIALYPSLLGRNQRPAGVIAVSGVEGWDPFSLPLLSVFLATCGFHIVDQEVFYAQGPGEVLLKEGSVQRAHRIGVNVAESVEARQIGGMYRGSQGICPVCHMNVFSVLDGKLVCATCQTHAEVVPNRRGFDLLFDMESKEGGRWARASLLEHLATAVLPSASRFQADKQEISKRAARYRSYLS